MGNGTFAHFRETQMQKVFLWKKRGSHLRGNAPRTTEKRGERKSFIHRENHDDAQPDNDPSSKGREKKHRMRGRERYSRPEALESQKKREGKRCLKKDSSGSSRRESASLAVRRKARGGRITSPHTGEEGGPHLGGERKKFYGQGRRKSASHLRKRNERNGTGVSRHFNRGEKLYHFPKRGRKRVVQKKKAQMAPTAGLKERVKKERGVPCQTKKSLSRCQAWNVPAPQEGASPHKGKGD